ncbi:putative MHC class I antigen protein [Naja naja]|nr:putative MHC class I antigen protein [Naja naja]
MKPRVSWMEKVGKEDPQYWERETKASYVQKQASRQGLETLRNRYNQSEGSLQLSNLSYSPLLWSSDQPPLVSFTLHSLRTFFHAVSAYRDLSLHRLSL